MPNEADVSEKASQDDACRDPLSLYLADIRGASVLSREDELRLARLVKQGDPRARELFIRHNLRLVISIAKRYVRRCRLFSLDDLIQEGNIGLLKALEEFDPELGFKFSTPATTCIRRAISRAIDERDAVIHLPGGVASLKRDLFYATRDFVSRYERLPTDDELCDTLDITRDRLSDLHSGIAQTSLDAPFGDEDANLHHFIIDERAVAPDEAIGQSSRRKATERFLSAVLDPQEKVIIESAHGFDERQGEMDFLKIADKLGLGRERVRQKYFTALRKLQQAGCPEDITDF